MVRVTVWVPLVLLVLTLQQSHEDSGQFSDGEIENIDLETYIQRIREQKQQTETFHGECKEQLEKGKSDSEAAFTSQKLEVDKFNSKLQQSENIISNLKKQIVEKDGDLQSKNEKLLQMQAKIDGLKNREETNKQTIQELRNKQNEIQTTIDEQTKAKEANQRTIQEIREKQIQLQAIIDRQTCTEEANNRTVQELLKEQKQLQASIDDVKMKLNESESVNSRLQRQQDEFKIKFEQSASVNNNLKKQLEAKEEVLRSKNEERKQMQTTIDDLTKTVDSVKQTVLELCGQFKDGCPYLLDAIRSGDVNSVKILVNYTNDNCTTDDHYLDQPLIYAARFGQVAVVRVLLEGGANLDRINSVQCTALHQAAYFGHLDVGRMLLDWGAKVDPLNSWQNTPLHDAARRGHLSVAKLLVERGADVWMTNKDDHTPSELAWSEGHDAVAEWLDSVSGGSGVSGV